MARALSQVYTIIRGSVGGLTYAANQYHQIIIRARTAPVQPISLWRTAIKSAFSSAQTKWRDLTDLQRAGWNSYAALTQYTGPLGKYAVPGRQMFIAISTLRDYLVTIYGATIAAIGTPPSTPGFLSLGIVNTQPLTAPGTGFEISYGNPLGNGAVVALAEISQAFEPTRNQWKGPWLPDQSQDDATAAGATGNVAFTGLVVGKAYFYRIRLIASASPLRISPPFIGRVIATTTVAIFCLLLHAGLLSRLSA